MQSDARYLTVGQRTHKHVEGIVILETGNQRGDERVTCDSGESVALVTDMFDLFKPNH
jgi:hypothetical protein